MREPPPTSRPRRPSAVGARDTPVRVVLADDSPDLRALLAMRLARVRDVELVAAVGDGEGALRAIEQHRPDVALLDVSMPPPDGFEVARRALARDPDIRVVILTGHPTDLVDAEARAAGATAVVQKGGPLPHLLAVLRGEDPEGSVVG